MADRGYLHRLRTSGGPSSDLLVLLDRHRVMTTDRLARATGTPERSVRYRLERLHSHGLIECIRPGRERGSAPRHWWLRPSGARLAVGTAAAEGRPSGMFVAHAAAITEVWLAFVEHGPAAGIRVRKWLTDRAGWQEWERSGRWSSHPSRLTPDALAMLTLPDGGEAVVFVEVDLASMTQTVLKQKVARYLAYADDLVWQDRYPYCPPMLHLDAGLKIITVQQAVGRLFSSICRRRRYVVGDADLRRLLPGALKIKPSLTSQNRPAVQPHLRNLDRWQRLIDDGDLTGLRRVMTGVDTDSVQMREVSPMGGLLPQHERAEVLRQAS